MTDDTITDADVLALIDEDDRRSWKLAKRAIAAGYEDQEWIIDLLRRLALARRATREAAAVERGEIEFEIQMAIERARTEREEGVLYDLLEKIRARGQS